MAVAGRVRRRAGAGGSRWQVGSSGGRRQAQVTGSAGDRQRRWAQVSGTGTTGTQAGTPGAPRGGGCRDNKSPIHFHRK